MINHLFDAESFAQSERKDVCGCSSMVELQPSKLITWVRFPSPAPKQTGRQVGDVRFKEVFEPKINNEIRKDFIFNTDQLRKEK